MTGISDLDILQLAADIAEHESMRTWRSSDLVVEIKPDGSPVSATDKLIEHQLRELLAAHRPDDRILGEEEGDTGTNSRCWVLDPIDGTGSFVAGRRAWGSLIALEVDGRPVAGMVTMPALGRRWWGTLDGGAFVTDEPSVPPRAISVSTEADTARMRWSSGPIDDELDGDERARIARYDDLGRYVPMEEWTTYPALMVAEGSLELAVHFGQRWDHAALAGVVVAAGGTIAYDPQPSGDRRFAATFTNGWLPGSSRNRSSVRSRPTAR
jgi:histidinol-phosphatase